MISGGRFLGTALESTQKAVSRVQEQLGGHGGGRGGRRPPAGSQSQAKARRRRAESWPFGILLPRRSSISSITPLGWLLPELVPLLLRCPELRQSRFPLLLPRRFQRGGDAEAAGARAAALQLTMLLCCGEEGGRDGRTEGGMRLSASASIPGHA